MTAAASATATPTTGGVSWAEALERSRRQALRSVLEATVGSEFYRRRHQGLLPNVAALTPEVLDELPVLTKAELRAEQEEYPPWGRASLAEPGELIQVQQSSGTSGRPLYIPVTRADLDGWIRSVGRGMAIAGMGAGDVVLQGFAMGRAFGGGLPLAQIVQGNGMAMLPVGAEAGADRLLAAVSQLRPTVAIGTPHFLAHVAASAEEVLGHGVAEGSVRTVYVGGEPGGEALKPRLSELWGATVHEALGASEVQPGMWVECGHSEGMHFHAYDNLLVELLGPDGRSQPLEPGVSGELVCTDLSRRGLRLLRYQLGDVLEVVGLDCPCGRGTPRVRVAGRSDDMLIVRGVNVYPSAVQRAVGEFHPEVSGRIEIQWGESGHSTQTPLSVAVELGDAAGGDTETLRGRLEAAIRGRCACKARVDFVDPGTFRIGEADKARLVRRVRRVTNTNSGVSPDEN